MKQTNPGDSHINVVDDHDDDKQQPSLPIRIDENWTPENEQLAKDWLNEAKQSSDSHNNLGKTNKRKHAYTGLPALLIPCIFAPIVAAAGDFEGSQYLSMSGFIATGIFSTIHAFFDYKVKHQKHMDYSARYADVYTSVRYELTKGKKFRRAPDAFLQEIQSRMDFLSATAPDL